MTSHSYTHFIWAYMGDLIERCIIARTYIMYTGLKIFDVVDTYMYVFTHLYTFYMGSYGRFGCSFASLYTMCLSQGLQLLGVVREDSGVYDCVVENVLGRDQQSARVRVEGEPQNCSSYRISSVCHDMCIVLSRNLTVLR